MKNLILIIFIIAATISFSQTKYYSTNGNNRLTLKEVKSMLLITQERITKTLGENTYGSLMVTKKEVKKDSIIIYANMKYSDDKPTDFINSQPLSEFKEKNLPYFNLKTLLGENFNSKQLIGKPTMINFWFTQCPPCIEEMPALNKIAEKYKDDFNFIAITYNSQDEVKKFLRKQSFNFKHLVNAKSYTKILGLESYPMSVFLNKNGIVKEVTGGIPYKKSADGKMIMGQGIEVIALLEELKK